MNSKTEKLKINVKKVNNLKKFKKTTQVIFSMRKITKKKRKLKTKKTYTKNK